MDSHLSTCVCTQSPKYLEMAQRHISLSVGLDKKPTTHFSNPIYPNLDPIYSNSNYLITNSDSKFGNLI
jgi:hypothetical protein